MSFADVQNMFAAYAESRRGGRMVTEDEWDEFVKECDALGVKA